MNQWASSFHANRRLVMRFFGAVGGTSGDVGPMAVGDALGFALSATAPEPLPGAAGEDGAANGASGKRPGSGKSGSSKGSKGKGGKGKGSPSSSRPTSPGAESSGPKLSLKARVLCNPVLYGVSAMVLK